MFATDSTDAILDINGYFDSYTDTSALQFYPLTPCRVADIRLGKRFLRTGTNDRPKASLETAATSADFEPPGREP